MAESGELGQSPGEVGDAGAFAGGRIDRSDSMVTLAEDRLHEAGKACAGADFNKGA